MLEAPPASSPTLVPSNSVQLAAQVSPASVQQTLGMTDSRLSFLGLPKICCLSSPIFHRSYQVCLGTALNQTTPGGPSKPTTAGQPPFSRSLPPSPHRLCKPPLSLHPGGKSANSTSPLGYCRPVWGPEAEACRLRTSQQVSLKSHDNLQYLGETLRDSAQPQLWKPGSVFLSPCLCSPYPHAYQAHSTCAPLLGLFCWAFL